MGAVGDTNRPERRELVERVHEIVHASAVAANIVVDGLEGEDASNSIGPEPSNWHVDYKFAMQGQRGMPVKADLKIDYKPADLPSEAEVVRERGDTPKPLRSPGRGRGYAVKRVDCDVEIEIHTSHQPNGSVGRAGDVVGFYSDVIDVARRVRALHRDRYPQHTFADFEPPEGGEPDEADELAAKDPDDLRDRIRDRHTVGELKDELRDRGLRVGGNKPELVDRLAGALKDEGNARRAENYRAWRGGERYEWAEFAEAIHDNPLTYGDLREGYWTPEGVREKADELFDPSVRAEGAGR